MAVLDETNRQRVMAHVMRVTAWPALTKPEVRAALDATDDWIESASGASAPSTGYNSALPLPFRTTATTVQKTFLFCYVAMRRAGILTVPEDQA